MLSPFKTAVLTVVAFASMATLAIATGSTTRATDNSTSILPVQVVPTCSDKNAKVSLWKVSNQNATNVTVTWNNFENDLSGSFEAIPGESTLTTGYNPLDPNNTTKFTWPGNPESATNAQVSACPTPEPAACIDGKIQQSLHITWLSNSSVAIKTANGALLCDDVTVYFSSYTMPDNYDGNGFYGNPTATPQHIFHSNWVVLKKGTDGSSHLSVDLPDRCKNVQVDVYYGPEIAYVGPEGHGTQNIESKVYLKDTCHCEPGQGGVEEPNNPPVTPVTPTTPVVPTPTPEVVVPTKPVGGKGAVSVAPIPAELPETGAVSPMTSTLYALLLGAAVYAITLATQYRRNEQ